MISTQRPFSHKTLALQHIPYQVNIYIATVNSAFTKCCNLSAIPFLKAPHSVCRGKAELGESAESGPLAYHQLKNNIWHSLPAEPLAQLPFEANGKNRLETLASQRKKMQVFLCERKEY